MRIFGIFLFLAICLTMQAQSDQNLSTGVDEEVFPNPVFILPDPPKPIKGWEMKIISDKDEKVLQGKYPGEIIKFRFKGTAVGVMVYADNHSGIIEYSLDGQPWFELDVYSKNDDAQLKAYTLDKDLKNRKHTLQIRVMEMNNPESAGNNFSLQSFYFNRE